MIMKYESIIKIFIKENEGETFGPGVFRLLDFIDKTDSIKEAANKMNISYSKALKLIDRVESCVDFEVVERLRGGQKGGNSRLTDSGRRLLLSYKNLVTNTNEYLDTEFQKNFYWLGENDA